MYDYQDDELLEEHEPISEYLTPREVMDLLYIGKNTLYKLLNSGELKGFRIGRQWRVSKQSLMGFVEQNERNSVDYYEKRCESI
nr:helix-turn-helix domain-containing protein [uncultured Oscillibacter sp.]